MVPGAGSCLNEPASSKRRARQRYLGHTNTLTTLNARRVFDLFPTETELYWLPRPSKAVT